MRHYLSLWILICLLALQPPARACGLAFPAGAKAAISEEDALIIWEPETQTQHLIRRSYFDSDQPKLGFLVPTPTRPELGEADDKIFAELVQVIQPKVKHAWLLSLIWAFVAPNLIGAQGESSPSLGAVKLLEQKQIGPYQASVLQASEPTALSQWLAVHQYPLRPELEAWLAPYLKAGWYFTAFQLTQTPDSSLALPAMRLSFQTERPFYPYTEPSSDSERRGRQLRLWMLSPGPMQGMYDSLAPEMYDGYVASGQHGAALAGSLGRSSRLYSAPLPSVSQEAEAAFANLGLTQTPAEKLWLSAWLDQSERRPDPQSLAEWHSAEDSKSLTDPAELYFYPHRPNNEQAAIYTPPPETGYLIFIPLDLLALIGYVIWRYRRRKRLKAT